MKFIYLFAYFFVFFAHSSAESRDLQQIKADFYKENNYFTGFNSNKKIIDLLNLKIENTNCELNSSRCGARDRSLKSYNKDYSENLSAKKIGSFDLNFKVSQNIQNKLYAQVELDLAFQACQNNQSLCVPFQNLFLDYKTSYSEEYYQVVDLNNEIKNTQTQKDKILDKDLKMLNPIQTIPVQNELNKKADDIKNIKLLDQQKIECQWNNSKMRPRILVNPTCDKKLSQICYGYVDCKQKILNQNISCSAKYCNDPKRCFEDYLSRENTKIKKLN